MPRIDPHLNLYAPTKVADSDLLAGYGTTSFTVAYDYEAHRPVRTQVQTKYSTTTLAQFDYVTDAVGRRQTREQSGTVFGDPSFNAFDYNARGEVTQSKRFAGTVADPGTENTAEDRDYAFDPIGNRKTSNVGNSATPRAYTANQLNQYTALTQPSQSPTHDADGNLTGDGTWTYTWDAENRLVRAEKTYQRLDFKYDYLGRRVCKQVFTGSPGNWMLTLEYRFLYDGWNLIAILDGEAAIAQSFLWGLDLRESLQGAGGVGGLLAIWDVSTLNNQPSTHCASYDANGNVSALVNLATGAITAHYEYGPFGEPLAAEGTLAAANPFRFSTKFTDDETGMLYYGYRYYIPAWGRWASRDPSGERGGLNLCGFISNGPIGRYDLLGLYSGPGLHHRPCTPGAVISMGNWTYVAVMPGPDGRHSGDLGAVTSHTMDILYKRTVKQMFWCCGCPRTNTVPHYYLATDVAPHPGQGDFVWSHGLPLPLHFSVDPTAGLIMIGIEIAAGTLDRTPELLEPDRAACDALVPNQAYGDRYVSQGTMFS
jgi:RHS repeat-associated protein